MSTSAHHGDSASRVHPSWPPALTDDPQWSQTCANGHFTRVRTPQRPTVCPTCGASIPLCAIDTQQRLVPPDRKKRPSGAGALFTEGDGRLLP